MKMINYIVIHYLFYFLINVFVFLGFISDNSMIFSIIFFYNLDYKKSITYFLKKLDPKYDKL